MDTVAGLDFSTTEPVNGLVAVTVSDDGCGGDVTSLDQWTDLDLTAGSSTCTTESTDGFFTQMSAGLFMVPDGVCVLLPLMFGINRDV